MRVRAAYLSLAVVAVVLVSALGIQAKPAQGGAFLTEYAGSVDEIVQQVEANRLVALRYAKHFRMDPASVLVYFRGELSLATLDDSASMVVYLIGESSKIENETRDFKKGAKVFVDRQGIPILEYGTGNPLGTSLEPAKPEQVSNPSAEQQPVNTTAQATAQTQPEQGPTTTAQEDKSIMIPTNPTTPPVISPTISPTEVASVPAAGDAGPLIPEIQSRDSESWLLPLGLAGAVAALVGVGGGSSTSGSPGDPRTDGGGNPPPIVPEPISLTVMGSALAAFGGAVWRRRRAR